MRRPSPTNGANAFHSINQLQKRLMAEISTYKLDAAFVELQEFDHFARPHDFIEVSLWNNGEGFDAHLSTRAEQVIRLTWGEFKALKKLVKELGG